MKAIVQSGYGQSSEVLRVAEVPVPILGPRDLLVRVRAASLHPYVWHVVTGNPSKIQVTPQI
jgi:NADPH:quinone reductase-like Zn-dependent oxidoreductase